jgi:predicted phage baseplate assembly protein
LHKGGYVVLTAGLFTVSGGALKIAGDVLQVDLYKIADVAEASRAEFAISGKITRLLLRGDNYNQYQNHIRETAAFVQSEPLQLADYPVDTPVSGDTLPVNVSAGGLVAGRRLIVRGTRVSDNKPVVLQATLVATNVTGPSRCELKITPPLPEQLKRESVVVHANVALASHGESVSQILGAGNASIPFQRFELKQLPLTYRAAGNEVGVAAELTVHVDDIAWAERPTLYGAGATDRAYALATDEQGRNFVTFGDGLRGTRLPSGVNNVRAGYRKGIGAAGNVGADKLSQLMTRPLGLKSVSNLRPAEGGTDPEAATAARRSMPLATRTLGRAVSVLDYEDFAAAFSGIAKAQARVLHVATGSVVAITIASPDPTPLTPASPVWINLLGALKASGDPHVAVVLLPCQASTFRLGLKVKRDLSYEAKTVLAAVETALRAHYAFDARELGQPVQQSEIIAVAQGVPGVTAVDINYFYGGTQPIAQTLPSKQVRLLAARIHVEGGVALPAELLMLDSARFDQLEEMP